MKIFEKFRKMILSLLIVILLFFSMPIRSEAGAGSQWVGNTLGQPIMQFAAMVGDIGIGVLHKFVLDNNYGIINSVMLDKDNQTVEGGDLSLNPKSDYNNDGVIDEEDANAVQKDKANAIDHTNIKFDGTVIGTSSDVSTIDKAKAVYGATIVAGSGGGVVGGVAAYNSFTPDGASIPNIMICPEYIFSNRIALLDVDFVNPTEFKNQDTDKAVTKGLKSVISSWYRAFRNIAIVAMLTILVYIGIRIIIGSTAQDKAKYKERLQDWLVGLCLIFIMHYIMAGTLMVTKGITNMLSNVSPGYVVKLSNNFPEPGAEGDKENVFYVKENITGYVRLMAQQDELADCFAYVIMYLVLVIFTYMFLIKYIKRVLYMAFFTMIAPLVAMTYPLDKLADGKSQGFSMWFKEYLMNALIQPVHLILYTVFISSATSLAKNNIIYAMVALGFLIPAEKFIKSMFRLDQGKTTGFLGDIAGGALAVQGMKSLSNAGKGLAKSSSGGGSSKSSSNSSDKIRVNKSENDYLAGWKADSQQGETARLTEGTNSGVQTLQIDDGLSVETGQDNSNSVRYAGTPTSLPDSEPSWNTEDDAGNAWSQFDTDNANIADANNDYGWNSDGPDWGAEDNTENDWSQFDMDNIPNLDFDTDTVDFMDNTIDNDSEESAQPEVASEEDEPKEKSRWEAIKGTAERGLRAVGNGIYDNRRRIIKGAVGTFARGAAGMVGASIGLAAGITTGDLSKVATLTTGGLYAGRAIGNKATNAGEALFDKGYGAAQTIHDAYREEKVGLKQAERERKARENARAKSQFMRDNSEIARYKEVAAKTNQDYRAVMENAWNYREAGITDGDKIAKALEIENKHRVAGESAEVAQRRHNNMIGVMQATKNMSEDTILDDKKRKAFEASLTSKLGSKEKAEELIQLAAETVDQGQYYKDIKKAEADAIEKQKEAEAKARQKKRDEKNKKTAEKQVEKEREQRAKQAAEEAKQEAKIQNILNNKKGKETEHDVVNTIRRNSSNTSQKSNKRTRGNINMTGLDE